MTMKQKKTVYAKTVVGAIALWLLCSCSARYTTHETILKAENLLYTQADSAYRLLSAISHPELLPRADYAAWCLHYTHARYKLYLDINSDSLIQIAVNYYDKSRLKKYSGTSYYLLGCVQELLHQNEKAMLAYKTSLTKLENVKEYDIAGLATINMGYIYAQDKNYLPAKNCFIKSLALFQLSENKRYQMYSCLETSKSYQQLNNPFDSIIFYSNKALQLARELNDSSMYYEIISNQGELFYNKNKNLAIRNLVAAYNYSPKYRARNSAFLAYIYAELNRPDSAAYYLKNTIITPDRTDNDVLINLAGAYVYKHDENYNQAFNSIEQAYLIQNSIFKQKLKSQIYQIDKQYDLTEKSKENAQLKITNRSMLIWITLLLIVCLLVMIFLQILNNRLKKKKIEFEIKHQKMEFELKEKELENKRKHEILLSKLHQRVDFTIRFNDLNHGKTDPKKQDEFYEKLIDNLILTQYEWQYYIDETNNLYNNKIANLLQKHSQITFSDTIVIVLISLGINITEACSLLKATKETMYTRRKRIKKHLGIDAEADLEKWLMEFVKQEA